MALRWHRWGPSRLSPRAILKLANPRLQRPHVVGRGLDARPGVDALGGPQLLPGAGIADRAAAVAPNLPIAALPAGEADLWSFGGRRILIHCR